MATLTRFAHPPADVACAAAISGDAANAGFVTLCMDHEKGRCARDPCRSCQVRGHCLLCWVPKIFSFSWSENLRTSAPNKQIRLGTTIGQPQVQPRPQTTATMQTAVAALRWLSPRSVKSATQRTTWYEHYVQEGYIFYNVWLVKWLFSNS